MRWVAGAGLGLMLACNAEAQVQAAEFVGSWVCDANTRSDPRGIDLVMQTNPVFDADGGFAEEMSFSASGNTANGEVRALSGRLATKGTWTLDDSRAWLRYDEALLSELKIDGQAVDPTPYQKQLVDMVVQPHANPARIVSGSLEMRSRGEPIACRRRGESDPS